MRPIGLARLHTRDSAVLDEMLARIQNDLFDLGADVCFPDDTRTSADACRSPIRRSSGSKPRSMR